MKVRQWVTVETEVDVHVGVEDIAAAIGDDPDAYPAILSAFSNIITFCKAIPDDIMSKVTEPQRKVILEHLDVLALRLRSGHQETSKGVKNDE